MPPFKSVHSTAKVYAFLFHYQVAVGQPLQASGTVPKPVAPE